MNQFSDSLLTLPETFNVWSWEELATVSWELFDALKSFNPDFEIDADYEGQKSVFLCFIIAMSDQDLFECFGILPPYEELLKGVV